MIEPVICARTTVDLPLAQHEHGQHQFGHAAEADVEQPADRLPDMRRDLLGAAPHPVGQHRDRERAGGEHPDGPPPTR